MPKKTRSVQERIDEKENQAKYHEAMAAMYRAYVTALKCRGVQVELPEGDE